MSRSVASVVLTRTFGSTVRKAVALVLADHADGDEWTTVVGQARIAAEAEVGERTVRRVLADFEAEGLIVRNRRHRKDGTRTSDRVRMVRETIESLPAAVAASATGPPGQSTTTPTGQGVSGLPATQAGPTGHSLAAQDPSGEPSVEPSATEAAPSRARDWALRWCAIRGQKPTRAVLKVYIPQIQDFIEAGGEPSEDLLRQALEKGFDTPGGWGFVTEAKPEPVPDFIEEHWARQRERAEGRALS